MYGGKECSLGFDTVVRDFSVLFSSFVGRGSHYIIVYPFHLKQKTYTWGCWLLIGQKQNAISRKGALEQSHVTEARLAPVCAKWKKMTVKLVKIPESVFQRGRDRM